MVDIDGAEDTERYLDRIVGTNRIRIRNEERVDVGEEGFVRIKLKKQQ